MNELVRLTARQAVELLKNRDVTPLELIDAALQRIQETDGTLNALPTLCVERARSHAEKLTSKEVVDPPRG